MTLEERRKELKRKAFDKLTYREADKLEAINWVLNRVEEQDKEVIAELETERKEFERILWASSPDTHNLDSFKGLVRNQMEIFKKRMKDKIIGKSLMPKEKEDGN